MKKTKAIKVNCIICNKPKSDFVPCGYCKLHSHDKKTKVNHGLCDDCFLDGCPVLFPRTKPAFVDPEPVMLKKGAKKRISKKGVVKSTQLKSEEKEEAPYDYLVEVGMEEF